MHTKAEIKAFICFMVFNSDDFWGFVTEHLHDDVNTLRLRYHGDDVLSKAITQIACRQRFGKKLAETLDACPRLIFANELCGEQCTSDDIARIHADLIPQGCSVVDLTSGLGIDAMHIACNGNDITACEQNPDLAEALRLNASMRGLSNLHAVCCDSVDSLRKGGLKGDVAFIDPARRANDGRRLFGLSDCVPDVTGMMDDFRRHFKRLVIKASPMIDIHGGIINVISGVTDIYVLGTATQCKELVAVCDLSGKDDKTVDVVIHAVTITSQSSQSTFSYNLSDESGQQPSMCHPIVGEILYEPYPSVMKSGGYRVLARKYNVNKLAPDTHLYLNSEMIEDFPGQPWRIVDVLPWQSKVLKQLKQRYPVISVSTRNFDMPAATLQAKLRVKEGDGHLKLMAVTLYDKSKCILILER